jgi:hypothetical protein
MGLRVFVLDNHGANEWEVGGSGLLEKCRGRHDGVLDTNDIGLAELSLKFVFRKNRKRDDPSNLRRRIDRDDLVQILRDYHQHLLATCRLGLGFIHWHHCCQAGSRNLVVFSFNKPWGDEVS